MNKPKTEMSAGPNQSPRPRGKGRPGHTRATCPSSVTTVPLLLECLSGPACQLEPDCSPSGPQAAEAGGGAWGAALWAWSPTLYSRFSRDKRCSGTQPMGLAWGDGSLPSPGDRQGGPSEPPAKPSLLNLGAAAPALRTPPLFHPDNGASGRTR